jgi:hypothetical protein
MGGESIVRRNYNHSKSNGTVLSIEKAVPAGGGGGDHAVRRNIISEQLWLQGCR